MRRSDAFLLVLGLLALLLEVAWVDAAERRAGPEGAAVRAAKLAMVRRLGLTDLCLFTEARYTRHPSQADRFAPFQDHPQALEHFPSGSLMASPPLPELPADPAASAP